MGVWPAFVKSTLVLAGLYGLLAAGFVIVYRTSRVLNLALGAMLVLLVYVGTGLQQVWGRTELAALGVVVVAVLVGWIVSAGVVRPFVGHSSLPAILATLALAEVLLGTSLAVWRGAQMFFPVSGTRWRVLGWDFWSGDVWVLGVATVSLGGLLLVDRFTDLGRRMRAVADDSLLAAQRGINVNAMLGGAWIVGVVLIGLAGMLLATRQPVGPGFEHVGLKALPVAIVGGLDSVKGVVPAALLVAAAETVVALFIDPLAGEAVPFALLLLVMLVRPWGLFGSREELERI